MFEYANRTKGLGEEGFNLQHKKQNKQNFTNSFLYKSSSQVLGLTKIQNSGINSH